MKRDPGSTIQNLTRLSMVLINLSMVLINATLTAVLSIFAKKQVLIFSFRKPVANLIDAFAIFFSFKSCGWSEQSVSW